VLLLVLSLLAADAGSNASHAASKHVVCPAELTVTERVAPPSGWSVAYAKTQRKLTGVGFFSGSPDEMASLVNDDEQTTKDGAVLVWRFPPSKERYWVACYYADTATTLRRALPAEVGTCRVTYDKPGSDGRLGAPKSNSCE
jgi:hypothetical protein